MASTKHTILVTGGSGFLGGNIIKVALERGYKVKAAVRSDSSAKKIANEFPKYKDQLSFVIVPDIENSDNYKDAFEDVTAVIHAASPFILNAKDYVKELFEPAVNGDLAALIAAKKYGGDTVKQVVLTSSHAAVYDPNSDPKRPGYTYDEKDWNMITEEQAKKADPVTAYCASKAFGERAAWDWMKENKPNFTLTTICPPWIFGPYVEPPTSTKHLSESVGLLWGLVGADGPHPFDFGGFADSREVAEAHVRALEVPEAAGQRFWVGQGFQWQQALDVLREVEPQIRDRLPLGKPGFREDVYKVDGSKAERVLGIKYRTLEETIKDTFDQLLYAEQVESKA